MTRFLISRPILQVFRLYPLRLRSGHRPPYRLLRIVQDVSSNSLLALNYRNLDRVTDNAMRSFSEKATR
jgi:hypothetical protein